jgi:hypothetical protein
MRRRPNLPGSPTPALGWGNVRLNSFRKSRGTGRLHEVKQLPLFASRIVGWTEFLSEAESNVPLYLLHMGEECEVPCERLRS